MDRFSDSEPSYPLQRFLEDPLFQDWVLRPDQSLEDYWRKWISENPASQSQVKEARKILHEINTPPFQLGEGDIQGVWKKIQQDIHPQSLLVVRKSAIRHFRLASAAACFAIVACIALFFFLDQGPDKVVHQTGNGETLAIILPDSSEVMLNANSILTYAKDWDAREIREVWVEGEAFFDVRHLEGHQPFKVYPASGVEVEVLGTRFNVYHRKNQTKVLLSEGNVTMNFTDSPKPSKILMSPGDLVEYDRQKIQKKRVNPEPYVSWTRKVLQLESTSLAEMVRMAEENYGMTVKVGTGVDLAQSASGSMPLSDGASFMQLTARVFNVQVAYRDSVYYIE